VVVKKRQVQHETGIVNKTIALIYSYRNSSAVWATMAKIFKSPKPHMHMEHYKGLYIQYNNCSISILMLTHVHMAQYARTLVRVSSATGIILECNSASWLVISKYLLE
jgi:hypothetical protein